jgi:hypothetical protein
MNDDQLEQRVRDSLSRLDLPGAPHRLLERAERIPSDELPRRSSRSGLVLLVATILIVSIYGGLQSASGGLSTPTPSPSAPPSEAVAPTASASESETPTVSSAPSPTPTLRPFPVERPDPSAPPVDPAPDDDLALAGLGDVPGLIDCGFGLPFSIDAIENPAGAEDLEGPEYDALRTLLEQYVVLGEFEPDPTAREVARGPTTVMFLVDHQHPSPEGGFPFVPVSIDFVDGYWLGVEGVDCYPRAVLPPGFAAATWSLDPAHTAPKPQTRALHILVTEHECANGRSASGRIGPAYVIATRFEIRIGVIVKQLSGGADCQAAPATPARLSLPGPIGDRLLVDIYEHLNNRSGG